MSLRFMDAIPAHDIRDGKIMAMDMPPGQAVEYRMEAPASPGSSNYIGNITDSIRTIMAIRDASAKIAVATPARPLDQILPRMDPSSSAMTPADRSALADGMVAGSQGRIDQGARNAPDSYVGDRIRLAAVRVQALDHAMQGRLRVEEANAVKCRTIAMAMDQRAGAYVEGGEKAADSVRRAIPQSAIAQCRNAVAAEASRGQQPNIRPASISPQMSHAHAPQRLDLVGSARQRIDPAPSVRQSISPNPSIRHRLDLAGTGRGS